MVILEAMATILWVALVLLLLNGAEMGWREHRRKRRLRK